MGGRFYTHIIAVLLVLRCNTEAERPHDDSLSKNLIDEGEYVPGTPGGAWSETDVEIVRKKVQMLLSREPDDIEAMFGCCSGGQNNKRPVSEMTLLRLAFHDCFAYTDGTGGCDGCLSWRGMNVDPPSPFSSVDTYCVHQFYKSKYSKTDNNGLDRLVEYLERIYTDADWPPGAPSLGLSLKASGKSRADLRQFAANVALERVIERSNHGCRYDYFQRQQVPLLENDGRGFAYGVWKCMIKLTQPMKFQYGRADCVTNLDKPYKAAKEERHSNAHANTGEILDDVKRDFNMSARDLIALSSIHGMIHPFGQGSIGTKYNWMGSGPNLSNMYYKILANRPTYDIRGNVGFDMKSNDDSGNNLNPWSVGDEHGNPVAMWGTRVSCSDCWNMTQSWAGGPCHWRPTMTTAPDCPNREQVVKDCYGYVDENGQRIKRFATKYCNKTHIEFTATGIQLGNPGVRHIDQNPTAGWSNMFMLNYEAGFYRKFDVDPVAMRGTGCDGINLEDTSVMWEDGWTGVNSATTSPVNQCNVTDVQDEEGRPIHRIVEEFADDHDTWASAFLDAWHRMQGNGYTDLKDAPQNSWMGYYTLKDMDADIGDHYGKFIQENKPVVFTSESVDPYVCGHQADRCATRVSEVYQNATVPMDIVGESCKNFIQCNDPTHGDLL